MSDIHINLKLYCLHHDRQDAKKILILTKRDMENTKNKRDKVQLKHCHITVITKHRRT